MRWRLQVSTLIWEKLFCEILLSRRKSQEEGLTRGEVKEMEYIITGTWKRLQKCCYEGKIDITTKCCISWKVENIWWCKEVIWKKVTNNSLCHGQAVRSLNVCESFDTLYPNKSFEKLSWRQGTNAEVVKKCSNMKYMRKPWSKAMAPNTIYNTSGLLFSLETIRNIYRKTMKCFLSTRSKHQFRDCLTECRIMIVTELSTKMILK